MGAATSKIVLIPIIAGFTAVLLSGCAMKQVRAYGECSGKSGGGGECKVGAEVIWEGGGNKRSLYNSLLATFNSLPDAASFQLDTAGSTIPYPSSGNLILSVKDNATGSVIAAQQFQWIKNGTVIQAASPDVVNNWVYANVGNGNSLSYDLAPFQSSYGGGMQVIAGQAKYEGSTQASYVVEFQGRDCVTHPSPHLCAEF